jgi:hypothetical protein
MQKGDVPARRDPNLMAADDIINRLTLTIRKIKQSMCELLNNECDSRTGHRSRR